MEKYTKEGRCMMQRTLRRMSLQGMDTVVPVVKKRLERYEKMEQL